MIYLKVKKLIKLRILLLGIQSIGMNIALDSHDTPSKKNHAAQLEVVRKPFSDAKNIVTLGIGGSFEVLKCCLKV